ncbi:MAG: hypothetical protein Q9171_005264 [Xanthocarpia ochracea]
MHSVLMKSLIFLPLLASNSIIRASPIAKNEIQRISDTKGNKGSKGSFDLLLTWTPYGFAGNVSIGSPPQQFPAFVDWTWIGQYVFTTKCQGDPERTSDCFAEDQFIFNQSQSRTFRNESALYPSRTWNPNHFFFYEDLTVDYASDIQTIGPSSTRVVIQAADQQFDITEDPYPFAGVYGLSPAFKGDNASIQSTFYQAWVAGAWPEPFTAFHYCYNGSVDTNKSTCQGADGLETLGGYDDSLVQGELSWYDIIFFPEVNVVDFVYAPAIYNYWTLNLTQLTLGDKVQALNESTGAGAVFDHASYGRGAPLSVNAYAELIATTGATPITLDSPPNNGNQSFYQVNCTTVTTFPPIRYQFQGHEKVWEITPSNYVEKLDDICVLNVRTLGDGDFIAGNFGETFAKDKYVVLDFEKNKVGLADLNW